VLVCPSRNESALLVVMEAAMLGRPAILSDRVGAAECLSAGSHFRFRAGDAAALAAQIAAAHARQAELARMGRSARRDYEASMSFGIFATRLMALVGEELARRHAPWPPRREAA
jgi:glycosyltransferase involved in cell wall biosynthesis